MQYNLLLHMRRKVVELHRGRDYADFEWQGSCADFFVSQLNLEPVKQFFAG